MATTEEIAQRFFIPASKPEKPHCTEELIRKSRFLAQSCVCPSRAAALEFVGMIRQANLGATHNCWAYVAGPPGDTANIGSSDDGEPHGTAGRPMLNALLHGKVGRICVCVSRWFGGIKLGTGGLARAYQGAVQNNLATLPVIESIARERWRIECPYQHLAGIKRLLQSLEAELEGESFGAEASLVVSVPKVNSPIFASQVGNLSNGTASLRKLDQTVF